MRLINHSVRCFCRSLRGRDKRFCVERTVRNVVVVRLQIVHQGRFQIGFAVETSLLYQFVNATIKAFNHTIRLRVTRRCQPAFDGDRGAASSKAYLPLGFLSLVAKQSVTCEPSSVNILLSTGPGATCLRA